VKIVAPIDPARFVKIVKPVLERNDLPGLLAICKSNWTKEQIVDLLKCGHDDARKVAALALSLVGCEACIPEVARQLKDPDPTVNQMAEHALWSIWFRCGSVEANEHLAWGSQDLGRKKYQQAIDHFSQALKIHPRFAEAYNQRAIAYYLQENYKESIKDCQRATELMPCHFGAWAGMGHCYAGLGKLDEARECYAKAFEINPHWECIGKTLAELNRKLGDV
jgi:tetratricopeptide (TPR) repeat protein